MSTIVASSGELAIPLSIRRRAGIKPGDSVEFEAAKGVITIRKPIEDKDNELTPEQRRAIDAKLAEGLEDVRQGRVYGPFSTIADLESSLRKVGKAC